METSSVTVFSSPPASPPQAPAADLDAVSLGRLSAHLDCLLDPAFFNCADAEIVLAAGGGGEETVVPVHRCILAARSDFFLNHFSALPADAGGGGEKPRVELAKLVPGGLHVGRDALLAVLGYMYTGRLKLPPREAVVCIDEGCAHKACRPAVDFIVESTYAASGFQIPELVSLFQRHLSDFLNIASNEDVVPIIHVAFTCHIEDLLNQCIQKLAASSSFNSMYLKKELPGDTYTQIKEFRQITFPDESDNTVLESQHLKSIRNIHMALDSHDVDLVSMLLKESAVSLDDAFAVHYAAIHCSPKVVSELLKLESANMNLKNNDGYTPLHMACVRLEPRIIVSLIEKGASVREWTPDGHDALTICKRLTRQKDFNRKLEKGQKRSSAYLCVDILERQTNRTCTWDLFDVEETVVTPVLVDDFHMMLLYLENRVAFARLFFPSEAQLAMCIAEADATEEFIGTLSKLEEVGLNEIPAMENKRLRERLDALSKTVKLGRRYFPNCSEVLDKFLKEVSADLAFLESGTPEDRQAKRMRFYEVKEDVRRAFDKDKAASAAIASTASSSPSPRLQFQGGAGKRQQAFRNGSKTR